MWGMEWADYCTVIRANRRFRHREDRIRQKEKYAPGPLTCYIPQGDGIYAVRDEHGNYRGHVRRAENGAWVKTRPRPLLAGVS